MKDPLTPKDISEPMLPLAFTSVKGPATFGTPSPTIIKGDFAKEYKGVDPMFAFLGGERGLQEARALRQTGPELFAKGVGNIVENVVFETIKAPGTIISGLGTVVGSEAMINNFWYEGWDAVQKGLMEKATEVYVPPSVQEQGLWGQIFNPYFFAGEGADAVGTMLSMMIPGRWLATAGLGAKLAKGLGKAGKLGELAVDGTKFLDTGKANQFGKFLVKTLGSTGRGLDFGKLSNNIDSAIAVTTNTLLESGAEAIDTYEQLLAQGKSPEEAGNIASKIFGLNMALLSVSNTILEKYVFNGFNRMPAVGKQLATALKGGTPVFRPLQQAGVKGLAGVLGEGLIEEGLQTSFQQAEGSPMGSLNRYFENIASLFGDDPDIEFGKAVFLGGVLGGGVGAISGVSDVSQQKQALYGRPAMQPNRLQAILGYKAREAQQGLIDIYRPGFEKLKMGKEALKKLNIDSLTSKEKIDKEPLEVETAMFALSNMLDDYVEMNGGNLEKAKLDLTTVLTDEMSLESGQAAALLNVIIPKSINSLSNAEALKLIQAKKDTMYFSRFASNPGGFELLDAHIEDMVSAMEDRYEENTGLKMTADVKNNVQKDLKERSKRFKDIYLAASTYNTNTRYDIQVAPDEQEEFNAFLRDASMQTLDSMLMMYELEDLAKRIEEETRPVTAKIATLRSKFESERDEVTRSKESKEALEKQFIEDLATEEAKIPDYVKKMSDLKVLNNELKNRRAKILENSTTSGLLNKWNNRIPKTIKLMFGGVEINFKNIAVAFDTIEKVLQDKGYAPTRDPSTGAIVLDAFYMKKGDTVLVIKSTPQGITVSYIDGTAYNKTVYNWKSLIEKFNNYDLLTPVQFTEEKLKYDAAKKEEEDLLMAEALLEAIAKKEKDLKKQLDDFNTSLNEKQMVLDSLNKQVDELKKKVAARAVKGKLTKEEAKQIRELAKVTLKQVQTEIKNTESQMVDLNNTIRNVEAQIAGLEVLSKTINRDRSKFKGKTFFDIFTKTEFKSVLDVIEEELPPITSELLNAFDTDDAATLDNILVGLKELYDGLIESNSDLIELRKQFKRIETVVKALINEINLGSLTGESIPDELLNKYPGLEEAIQTNKVLDYIGLLASQENYFDYLDSFAAEVAPYIPISAEALSEKLIALSELVEQSLKPLELDEAQARVLNMQRRFAVVERFRKELDEFRANAFSKLKTGTKSTLQQTPGWDLDVPPNSFTPLADTDERQKRVPYLITTAGLNIQRGTDGKDLLVDTVDGYQIPLVTDNVYQKAFFDFLDNVAGIDLYAIPYAPTFDDTDFDDIAEPDVAKELRKAIAGAPKKDNALYTVILEKVGDDFKVRMHKNVPLINSMMLPDTKFPDNDVPKMAAKAYMAEFITDVINKSVSLTANNLRSKKKVKEDEEYFVALQEGLAKYGIQLDYKKGMTWGTVYDMLNPYAIVFTKMKYANLVDGLRKDSLDDTNKKSPLANRKRLNIKGVSKGSLVYAVENNKPKQWSIQEYGLQYNKAGVPTNFFLVKADREGKAEDINGNEYSNLKPGAIYIKMIDRPELIPVELRTMNAEEVQVVLFLLNQFDAGVKSLDKKIDYLEGSLFVKGENKPLNQMPVLPSNKDRLSLMSLIMNWGFKSKEKVSPYDIFISKGNIVFGEERISIAEFKEAYAKGDMDTLKPLTTFLLNKRINANHLLLNNDSNTFKTLTISDGKLVALQKQGTYAKHILDGSFIYSIPPDIREEKGLPMFAQKYLYFNYESKVDAAAFTQEVEKRKIKRVEPKATVSNVELSAVFDWYENAFKAATNIESLVQSMTQAVTSTDPATRSIAGNKVFNNMMGIIDNRIESGKSFEVIKKEILGFIASEKPKLKPAAPTAAPAPDVIVNQEQLMNDKFQDTAKQMIELIDIDEKLLLPYLNNEMKKEVKTDWHKTVVTDLIKLVNDYEGDNLKAVLEDLLTKNPYTVEEEPTVEAESVAEPTPEPAPSGPVFIDTEEVTQEEPVQAGKQFKMDDKTYTIVKEEAGEVFFTDSAGVVESLSEKVFNLKIEKGKINFIVGTFKIRTEQSILNDAVQRGIITKTNCK